jgi:hypothetical protein
MSKKSLAVILEDRRESALIALTSYLGVLKGITIKVQGNLEALDWDDDDEQLKKAAWTTGGRVGPPLFLSRPQCHYMGRAAFDNRQHVFLPPHQCSRLLLVVARQIVSAGNA